MADCIRYAICKFFFQNCIERTIVFTRFTKMPKIWSKWDFGYGDVSDNGMLALRCWCFQDVGYRFIHQNRSKSVSHQNLNPVTIINFPSPTSMSLGIFFLNRGKHQEHVVDLYINQSSDIKYVFRRPRLFLGGV